MRVWKIVKHFHLFPYVKLVNNLRQILMEYYPQFLRNKSGNRQKSKIYAHLRRKPENVGRNSKSIIVE